MDDSSFLPSFNKKPSPFATSKTMFETNEAGKVCYLYICIYMYLKIYVFIEFDKVSVILLKPTIELYRLYYIRELL